MDFLEIIVLLFVGALALVLELLGMLWAIISHRVTLVALGTIVISAIVYAVRLMRTQQ